MNVKVPTSHLGPLQLSRSIEQFRQSSSIDCLGFIQWPHDFFNCIAYAGIGGSHGSVHVAVGGTLRNASIASADVLFWMHHCEIDRLWYLWQEARQGGPLLSGMNRQMTPWDEDVSEVLGTQALGYVYA